MRVLAFAASHRAESLNRQLLNIAASRLEKQNDIDLSVIEYSALETPVFNQDQVEKEGLPATADRIHDVFDAADALLIASPEYNWSVPGSLKNLVDWLSLYTPSPIAGKPIFLMCATPSERGGVVGLSHLKTVLESIEALVFPKTFGLGNAATMLSDDAIANETKALQLATMLDAFADYCRQLTADTTTNASA